MVVLTTIMKHIIWALKKYGLVFMIGFVDSKESE